MITNIPTKEDFELLAKENLIQSFNLLFKVYDEYDNYEEIKEDVELEDIWKYHRGTIRTSLILLHQGVEGLMKSVICDTTPLLLIDKPRCDWPSLPQSASKDFDNLYTISGENLLNTFCAVKSNIIKDQELIQFVEDIRQKRNQMVHGVSQTSISIKYIIESILKSFTIWFDKDIWLLELKSNLIENPLFGYTDYEYERALSYKYLDFCLTMLGKSKLSKYLSINLKTRNYYCPECKHYVEHEYGELSSKWAYLSPNKPNSTSLLCINCSKTFFVIRKECNLNGCKGNVIYDDTDEDVLRCLTCFECL